MSKIIWKPGTMLYPVPAVMVTARHGEKANIITISWVGTICTDPPMVSISVRPERYSYELIKQSGEFVINVPSQDLAFATDFCGVRSGRDVDKFDFLRLTQEQGTQVQAPIIKEAPLALECKVTQVVELGSHHLFMAEVVAVHVEESLIDEKGKLHLEAANLIAYNHGQYCLTTEVLGKFGFSVERKRLTEYITQKEKAQEVGMNFTDEAETTGERGKRADDFKRDRKIDQELTVTSSNREERRKDSNRTFGGKGGRIQVGENFFGEKGREQKQGGDNFFGERGRNAGGNKSFGGRGRKQSGEDFFDERGRTAGGNKPFGGRGGKQGSDDFFGERGRNAGGSKSFEGGRGKQGGDNFFGERGRTAGGNKPFGGRGGKQGGDNFFGERGRNAGGSKSFGGGRGKQGGDDFFGERGRNEGGNKSFGGRGKQGSDDFFNERDRNAGGNKPFGEKGGRKASGGKGRTFSGRSGGGPKSKGKK